MTKHDDGGRDGAYEAGAQDAEIEWLCPLEDEFPDLWGDEPRSPQRLADYIKIKDETISALKDEIESLEDELANAESLRDAAEAQVGDVGKIISCGTELWRLLTSVETSKDWSANQWYQYQDDVERAKKEWDLATAEW